MTGENFKRLNHNASLKNLKDKIQALKNECGRLLDEVKDTGDFDSTKYYSLLKEIERQEYYLWGLTK